MSRELAMPRPSMLSTVLGKTLRDQRKALIWWALGLGGTVLMYAALWPNIRDNAAQFNEYIKNLPEAIRNLMGGDYGTPAGYLQSELFSFLGPILFLVYTVGAGARAIAGEEEAGSLDLLLSMPLSRQRVLVHKFVAMVVATFALAFVMWLGIAALGPVFELRPDLGNFTGAILSLYLLAMAFGSLALAVGCATGSKGLAIGLPAGVALVTFLVHMFARTVEALEPFRLLSPFYYYIGNDPLFNGIEPVHALVLAAIIVVCYAVAAATFERRDLAA